MLRKIINIILGIIIVVLIIVLLNIENKEVLKSSKTPKISKSLSILVETGFDSRIYSVSSNDTWPEGYQFNEELSKCKNGSKLSWDNINNEVLLEGTSTDNCYVYFDAMPILASNVGTSTTGKNLQQRIDELANAF